MNNTLRNAALNLAKNRIAYEKAGCPGNGKDFAAFVSGASAIWDQVPATKQKAVWDLAQTYCREIRAGNVVPSL